MAHSVQRHLQLDVRDYDRIIRTFIPGYEQMVAVATDAIAALGPKLVLDLGAGTGALAERLLDRSRDACVELWDVDDAMLDVARARLARFGERARFVNRSFYDQFPQCDGIMASLALHHVRQLDAKGALYRRVWEALRPGGVFANADVTIPTGVEASQAAYREWAAHQVAGGFTEAEAWRHFEEWKEEDRYFSLDEELGALRSAGFDAGCPYRNGPATVLIGLRVE